MAFIRIVYISFALFEIYRPSDVSFSDSSVSEGESVSRSTRTASRRNIMSPLATAAASGKTRQAVPATSADSQVTCSKHHAPCQKTETVHPIIQSCYNPCPASQQNGYSYGIHQSGFQPLSAHTEPISFLPAFAPRLHTVHKSFGPRPLTQEFRKNYWENDNLRNIASENEARRDRDEKVPFHTAPRALNKRESDNRAKDYPFGYIFRNIPERRRPELNWRNELNDKNDKSLLSRSLWSRRDSSAAKTEKYKISGKNEYKATKDAFKEDGDRCKTTDRPTIRSTKGAKFITKSKSGIVTVNASIKSAVPCDSKIEVRITG